MKKLTDQTGLFSSADRAIADTMRAALAECGWDVGPVSEGPRGEIGFKVRKSRATYDRRGRMTGRQPAHWRTFKGGAMRVTEIDEE